MTINQCTINTQRKKNKNLNSNKVQTLRTENNKIHNEISDSNRLDYKSLYIAIQNRMKTTGFFIVKRR